MSVFSDEEIAEGYGYVRDKYIKAMGFDNYEFDPAMDTNSEDRADFAKIGDKMEIKQSVIDSLKQLFHPKAKAGFPPLTVRQFASVRRLNFYHLDFGCPTVSTGCPSLLS